MRSAFRFKDLLSFAAFGTMIVFCLSYFAFGLGISVRPPADRINVSMSVPDINSLVVGSKVLLRGIPVGTVTNTSTTIGAAKIDFYIDNRYRIPLDSEIRLENLSALGESYIALIPRTVDGPMWQDGQRIAADAVTPQPSISELTATVGRVLKQVDPEKLKRIINELDAALPDPAAVLPNISRASTLLRNTIADFQGRGRAVFDNIQTLLERSEYVAPALAGLTQPLFETSVWVQDLFKEVAVIGRRNLVGDLTDFNLFIKRLQDFLDDRAPDLKVVGEAFLPKLNAIAAALMNFDTGQILDNMLAAIPPDGTVTLRVVP